MDFSRARILCVGDVMLDRFAYGDTDRVSPEAPVPVLLLRETRSMLGGAGNVARNVAALGGTAILLGLAGRDSAGGEIAALIRATPGLVDAHVVSARRPTTCKTRYLAAHQQIVRVDEESTCDLDAEEQSGLVAAIEQAVGTADAVILSDYGKGVICPSVAGATIASARRAGVPVYVDPKSDDFGRYRGAFCITPNLRELALASRLPVATDGDITVACARLMRETEAEAILVTR